MEISKSEYTLLEQFYNSDYLILDNEISELLLQKELIKHQSSKLHRSGYVEFSPELVITNNGKIVYESYRKEIVTLKRATFQSWVAVIISIGSLAVSIISLITNK